MKQYLFLLSLFLILAESSPVWADITVTDTKTVQASGGDYTVLNENAAISSGGTLKFINCGIGQSQTITVTLNGGVLEFDITGGNDSPHSTPCTLSNQKGGTFNNLTLTGSGTFIKSGSGYLASSPGASSKVTYSLDANSLIDIQAGTFIYGGQYANMDANKADLTIAKGAAINIWDTTNSLRCDVLSGEGRIYTKTQYNPSPIVVGAANGSGTFAGTIDFNPTVVSPVGANQIEFVKMGTGTQTMTGANTYAGYTQIQGGTLAFADGTLSDNSATSGTIGTGSVEIQTAGTLEFNSSANNTIVGVLSGSGVLKQSKAGSTLTLQNAANTFSGKLLVEAGTVNANSLSASAGVTIADGAAFQINSDVAQTVSAANRGTLIKSGSGALDLTLGAGSNGTMVLNGGTLQSSGNQFGSAVHATADAQINLSGPSPWQMTLYTGYTNTDSTMKAEITPGYSGATTPASTFAGTRWNMDDTANTNNARKVLTETLSMLSMTANIWVDKAITVDLANGRYDDWAGIFLYSFDDQGVLSDTPTTLLGFGGRCVKALRSGVTIQPGQYQLEVRLADFGGGVGYYADGNASLNYTDSNNNVLGVGIRLNGDTNLTGDQFLRMDIDPETGNLTFDNGSIKTWNPNVKITADVTIDAGKTLTVNNPNATAKSLTFDNPISGAGTLKLSNTGAAGALPVSIVSTEGSIEAENGIRLSVDGPIEGNLTLKNGSVMDIDPSLNANGSTVTQTIGGNVAIESGAQIYVDLTGVTADSVLNSVAGTLAIDPAAQIFFTTSDAQLPAVELTIFGTSETLTGLSETDIADMITLPDNLRFASASMENGFTVTLGDANSVPEPSSWLLLTLGAFVFAGRYVNQYTKTSKN